MGNTPSNQSGQGPSGSSDSPTRRGNNTSQPLRSTPSQSSRSQGLPHRHIGSRQQQSHRPEASETYDDSSHQAVSPSSNRPGSPRRRKSLELPDLNSKLTFTHAQDANALANQLEALETTGAGNARVKSPLGSLTPKSLIYDEDNSLGNTPPRINSNSKRISLTTGTRARSPQSTGGKPMSPLGDPIRADTSSSSFANASQGMPIPGAKPVRRPLSGADESDNPYFPPVARQRAPPITPGLPNYSHSPHTGAGGAGGSGVGLAHVEHAEQAEFDFSSRDRLAVNTNIPPTGPRQPSPARPAPAVVTTEHHHDHAPQDDVVSALPPGMTSATTGDQDDQFATTLETPTASAPRYDADQTPLGLPAGAAAAAANPTEEEDEQKAVPTLVTWNEGGKNVYVTGTFADQGWKTRLKMNKSTHDFSLMLNLPPGTHRLKFIVDDHWRISNELQTATDGDGNLVNWLEIEAPKKQPDNSEDWAMSEWAQKVSTAEMEQDDGSLWTTIIPPALVNFIQIEERAKDVAPDGLTQVAYDQYHQNLQQLLSTVPAPPTVPRHLKDPILNTSPKDLEGTVGGTAGDDNSILPVPNHVVLNHLTAAAIRNGTLAVGTTTRYKRKYISTLLFKPVGDH